MCEPVDYPFKPFAGSSHSWAIDQARALPPGPLRILDVGAGEGHILSAIRAARPDPIEAVAVEPTGRGPDERTTWVRDLNDVRETGFDVALLLDVLEHLPDPAVALSVVASKLRPGGTLLISVPNVAHWSVRASLLLGRFDYTERGILDRTHLRFFTRSSLVELVESAGCRVEDTSASIVPLELLLPEALTQTGLWSAASHLRRACAKTLPGLLAFQLLVRAEV